MVFQGTVISFNRDVAIVLTDDNHYLRVKTAPNFKVGQKIYFSDKYLVESPTIKGLARVSNRQLLAMATSFLLVLALGLYASASLNLVRPNLPIAAVVTVDINPSVKLSVAVDGQVVRIEALNADASTLNLDQLIGKNIDSAIESVVSQATKAGFINPADGILDYVVVSTVNLKENSEMAGEVQTILDHAVQSSKALQAVNLVLVDSTPAELQTAIDQAEPLGLVAISHHTGIDITGLSVKEFFADQKLAKGIIQNAGTHGLLSVADHAQVSDTTDFQNKKNPVEAEASDPVALDQLKSTLVHADQNNSSADNGSQKNGKSAAKTEESTSKTEESTSKTESTQSESTSQPSVNAVSDRNSLTTERSPAHLTGPETPAENPGNQSNGNSDDKGNRNGKNDEAKADKSKGNN